MAICEIGLLSFKIKEGAFDNFSFKNFVVSTIEFIENNIDI